ncbi:hypothetical protein ABZW30_24395 [Kitasatospora sp. NPDC004669]|uniref:hypothetical protein n=1 Tax=Kitasatospora sp. NPDC004669 TaxID=3154555 RepID=UPI0033A7EAFD
MPSRIPGRRRAAGLAGFAGLVLTIGLTLTGCGPSSADDGAKASSSPTVAAGPSAATPTAPAPPAAATPAATDPAPPSTVAPPAAPPTHPQSTPPKAPQPKVTTAQPPTDPEHTVAVGGGPCEIRSSAGNCYAAGQFCRNDDLGKSTHDAGGRVIYCRMVSGKPHWQA